jgi:hypothetical protein
MLTRTQAREVRVGKNTGEGAYATWTQVPQALRHQARI